MSIGERIELIIRENNLSVRAFSRTINCADTTILNIIAGKNDPGYKILFAIIKEYPVISPEWLLAEEGSMKRQKSIKLEPEDQNTLLELYRSARNEIKELKDELKEKNKQLGESIRSNLLLLEEKKEGGINHHGVDTECGSVG